MTKAESRMSKESPNRKIQLTNWDLPSRPKRFGVASTFDIRISFDIGI